MASLRQPRENGRTEAEIAPAMTLLANGVSGRWSVTLDESAGPACVYFLQIEGPSLDLYCNAKRPEILHELVRILRSPTTKQPLVLGQVNRIPIRLQWDAATLFFMVGPATRPLVRYSIQGADMRNLANAAEQASLDLD